MTTGIDGSVPETCALCGRPLPADPVEAAELVFCSDGCRDVFVGIDGATAAPTRTAGHDDGDGPAPYLYQLWCRDRHHGVVPGGRRPGGGLPYLRVLR
jgi:endogenous inhibitor of DNA gyrase (YacG/DUF329 family)